jgi:class 3 adenylate cyclase
LFDGPGRGLLAAGDLTSSLERVGLPVRAGLHAGEVELRGQDVAGVGVHIAARVMAEAAPTEVLVSRTVRDLVVGSEFRFEDRGARQLKGVEGEWQLFALSGI